MDAEMSRISDEELRKLVEMRQPGQFTHEANSNYDSRKGSPIQGHVITYTPDPQKNADGTTSYGWIFPCLVATDLLSDAPTVLESVATQLNAAPALAAEVLQLREAFGKIEAAGLGGYLTPELVADITRAALSTPSPVVAKEGR